MRRALDKCCRPHVFVPFGLIFVRLGGEGIEAFGNVLRNGLLGHDEVKELMSRKGTQTKLSFSRGLSVALKESGIAAAPLACCGASRTLLCRRRPPPS